MATYTYSISGDFPSGQINTTNLKKEIEESSISTGLSYIETYDNSVSIVFDSSLSAPDKTTLDGDTTGPSGGLIASHVIYPEILTSSILIEDDSLTSPPGSPEANINYLVASPATGLWAGKEDYIAHWTGTSWFFRKPSEGLLMWSKSRNGCLLVDNSLINLIFHSNVTSYEESESESTTTLTSYQTKIEMTTPSLQSGTYRIGYYYEISNGLIAAISSSKVTINGTTISEPSFDCNGDYISAYGFKQEALSGVNSIKIEYKTSALGSAKIRRARIEIRSVPV